MMTNYLGFSDSEDWVAAKAEFALETFGSDTGSVEQQLLATSGPLLPTSL